MSDAEAIVEAEQVEHAEAPLAHEGVAEERLDAADLACLEAFADGGVGDDPRYSDAFERVHNEINRLSGADFDAVVETSRAILQTEAKDLRVVGYLALAQVACSGVTAFARTVELMARLIERFGEQVHPRRSKARYGALQFIGQERMAGLIDKAQDSGQAEAREALQGALARLESAVRGKLGLDDPGFGAVSDWIREHPPEAVRRGGTTAKEGDGEQDSGGDASKATSTSTGLNVAKPADEKELGSALRRVLSFLREAERWSEHVALARAYRWSALTEPPADGSTTRLPAPRQTATAPIEAAYNDGRWSEGLAAAERAFLEPGGQFLFRIQRLGAHCARQAEALAMAERIETETALLMRRMPGLKALQFNDGTPFADEADRDWLDTLSAGGDQANAVQSASLDEQIEQAREVLATDGLGAAVHTLAPHPGAGGRELAQARLRQGSLCLEAERPEAARPLLEGVLDELESGGHAGWDRALTSQVLRLLLRATDSDASQTREERVERQARLRERLARLDLSSALAEVARPAESIN